MTRPTQVGRLRPKYYSYILYLFLLQYQIGAEKFCPAKNPSQVQKIGFLLEYPKFFEKYVGAIRRSKPFFVFNQINKCSNSHWSDQTEKRPKNTLIWLIGIEYEHHCDFLILDSWVTFIKVHAKKMSKRKTSVKRIRTLF